MPPWPPLLSSTRSQHLLVLSLALLSLLSSSSTIAAPPHVLVVFSPDGAGDQQTLATAIGDGAAAVVGNANVRVVAVESANYKRDVLLWADALVVGSGVYNGNAAPAMLEFSKCLSVPK